MTNKKAIPFFIKVPVILAVVIALGLVLAMIFENSKPRPKLPECTTMKSGRFEQTSMLAAMDRFADGDYRALTLNAKGDTWIVNKLGFTQDFTPYLEPKSTIANAIYPFEESRYSLAATFGNMAFVRTDSGRTLPIRMEGDSAIMLNQLGVCGHNWKSDVIFRRLNQSTFVSLEANGRLGFYNSQAWQSVIPREVPRSPDTLMGVESGNMLSVLKCGQEYSNGKARVRIEPGLLAYSSGEGKDFAVYKVAPDRLSLETQRLSVDAGTNPFSDFVVAPYEQIGFKTSGWLERDEKWAFYPLTHLQGAPAALAVETGEPLDYREEYKVYGEQEPRAVWYAERKRPYNILKEYGLTVAAPAGEAKKFTVTDKVAVKAMSERGLWTVLPGGRHLFVENSKSGVEYALLQCPL
ncbi:hypothetical protein AB1A81_13905 [Bdellovibrio bacteriovorus]|uniref:Uncharacterized protein n=1 Tax=Bdellovibrio bacteriovorus (strain ATCC 15356 / DSM 50701 / NCIMB 9529 / HD100) TaxID=264462 RepID=Q6MIX2_BDEBA|nr:hypothetical protein [Bdellovibrio bacteriovorus]CAE80791.1 hypothetical protein predicted by Glimmer/Critica [Bdellovibrio bacteriovorus HD100]